MSDNNESFAAIVAEMQTVTCDKCDFTVCPALTSRIDRLVAAHEREVAKLRETAASLNLQLKERDNDCFELAASEIKRKDATIAELKAKYADACRCADRYERELSDVATQCGHAKGQVAELKDALRKIKSKAFPSNAYDCYRIARAALEKTEGGAE